MVIRLTSALDVRRRAGKSLADQDDIGDDTFVAHAARDAGFYGAGVGHIGRDAGRLRPRRDIVLAGEVQNVEILTLKASQKADAPKAAPALFQLCGIGRVGWLRRQLGAAREIHGEPTVNGGMVCITVCQR